MNNFAYIDGQNLHSGISAQRWKLDHKKFREYLRDELAVTKAFIFLGFMEEHQDLYNALQEAGFILVFKPLLRFNDGQIKGNVDADMVLKVMVDIAEYDQAVIVSGDGDFAGMLRHLSTQKKLKKVIIPNKDTYSSLFKRMDEFDQGVFVFMRELKPQLRYVSPNYRKNTRPENETSSEASEAPKVYNATPKPAKAARSAKKPARPAQKRQNNRSKKPQPASEAVVKKGPTRKTLIPKKKAEANLLAAIENQSN